jgi:hypothetical protein
MDLTNYLVVPSRPIYTLVDTISDKKYIFVGRYEATDEIITKIIKKTKLEPDQEELLKKYYGNLSLTGLNTTLIKCFINVDDNITTIKQKIGTYAIPGVVPERQHLWVVKNKLSGDDIDRVLIRKESNSTVVNGNLKEYEVFLGLEYRNAHGIKLISGDINAITEKHYPEIDDNLYDVHSRLLETYGNIKNNIIYITTFDSVVDDITDDAKKLFFPLENDANLGVDTFKEMIMADATNVVPVTKTVETKTPVAKSMIIKANLNSDYFKKIDLDYIFINYQLSPEVPYIKLENEQYRFYTKNNQSRSITRDFKSPSKYLIDYERGYYEPIVSHKQILEWVRNPLTHREKQHIKEKKYYNEYSNLNDINFKIQHDGYYIDLIINLDGLCYVRNMEAEIDSRIIKKCNAIIKKINMMAKYTLNPLTKVNMSLMTFNLRYDMDMDADKFPISKLKTYIETLRGVYLLPQDQNDNLHLKYTKVNLYNTSINYKNLFLKLKQSSPNLSVFDFKKLWIAESTRRFSISEDESLIVLNKITAQYSKDDLNKSSIDYEITIIITKNFTDNSKKKDNYTIEIANCYNMAQSARIHEFIVNIFTDAKKKKRASSEAKAEPVIISTTFAADEDDEFDLDDDFLELEDDSDGESEGQEDDIVLDVDEETSAEEQLETYDDKEDIQMGKNSIRNYMAKMRQLDPKFKYKTDENHQSYSIKCGAVDMRQPIILTKAELRNFEQKNPIGFKSLAKLEWGSSAETKNFYMCPRIWCIRDKIALSDKQFVENKGRCPFCQGEIIDSQTKEMSGNQTVIIRRAGANKYWENTEISATKTKEWRALLYETEKDAHPGFLDPKLHPDGFCMPCCNSNKYWNYSKCLTIPIDAVTATKERIADVAKDAESVLVLDEVAIYNVKQMKPKKEFTKIKLPLQEGMIFQVNNGGAMYEVVLDKDGSFKFKKTDGKKKTQDERYLLGPEKFPLLADKIGALPTSIDDIFDNNTLTKTVNSKLLNNVSIFTRRGVPQISFNSFLCCMAYIKGMTLKKLLGSIVSNLEPEEYIGLNNGDVFLGFVGGAAEADKADEADEAIFNKWLVAYSDFAEKYKTRREFMHKVFRSMENFKKYCADMNVQKEPIFFQDLLSKRNQWFFKKGINIIIIERRVINNNDKIYIHMPQVDDLKTLYDDYESTCIIYKYRGIYEPITIVKTINDTPYFFNYYSKNEITLDANILPRINNMVNIVVSNGEYVEDTRIHTSELEHVSELVKRQQDDSMPDEFRPKYFVHDEYNKGIGISLENNVILYSSPFAINRYSKLKKILETSIKQMKSKDLKNKLDIMKINYGPDILDDGRITGVMLETGHIHPVKYEEFESHSLSDYEKMTAKHAADKQLYLNFKRELASVFQRKNKSIEILKKLTTTIISNDVIPVSVRRLKIWEIIVVLVNNITIDKAYVGIKTNKTCGKIGKKKCLRSKKCSRGPGRGGVPLEIGDKTIMLNFPRCRLNIPNGMKTLFIKTIADELLLSHQVRLEIFDNKFKADTIIHSTILTRETIGSEIKKFYKGNNFYLANNVKSIRPKFRISDPLIKVIRDSNMVLSETMMDIMATTITDGGVDMSAVSDIKAGKCIFPYKTTVKGEIETYNQCIRHENYRHGYTCATEVDADGYQLKYGFCNDNVSKEKKLLKPSIPSTSIFTKKGAPCVFPFKYKNVEYNKCIPDKKGKLWCATSVTPTGKYDGTDYCADAAKTETASAAKTETASATEESVSSIITETLDGYDGPYKNKYLSKYASKVKYDSLALAAEGALLLGNKCGGITLEVKGKYSLRKGNDLKDSGSKMEYSWVKSKISPTDDVKVI